MSTSQLQVRAFVSNGRQALDSVDAYAALLALGAVALVTAVAMSGMPLSTREPAWPLLLFALLAIVVERESIPVTAKTEVSVAFLPLVFVEVVFGPLAAAFVGAATMIPDFPWRRLIRARGEEADRPYLRWLVWTSNRVLTAACGGLVAATVLSGDRAGAITAATALALFATFATDTALTMLTMRVRRSENAMDAMRAVAKVAAAGIPIYGAVAALLAYAYVAVTPISAALFFIPALAAHRLFAVSRKQQEALTSLATANGRLEKANLSFASALVATLDARDRYTAGHSEAVANYARDIAAQMGCTEHDQQVVDLCGLVHDIGKIGLPPGLLEKAGALTPEERLLMEEHSAIGERILANVDDYAEIAVIVRHHHERWDGRGYPDCLAGEAIPMIARILSVADAYDAMTSHRPYRAALRSSEARRRLREGAGTQFDPKVVDAFEVVLNGAHPHYLAGRASTERLGEENREPAVALAS